MIKKLKCNIPASSTQIEIEIGLGLLYEQSSYIHSLGSRCAIITDTTLAPLYGEKLAHSLRASGINVDLCIFPHGEEHKTRATKEALENQLFEKGFGRDSCLIALGGGVVTDLTGFLAATYCRGIPHIMMPTSLLGMVDASIGGKTAVNVPYGKNMIGAIHQPKKVVIDLSTLTTLPKREFANGIVEMIKHGLIADYNLFDELEKYSEQILALDTELLNKVIFESCRIKKEIVERDEKGIGPRHLLNFGHTIGHALEQLTHYSLSHGEAVAIGILVESYLSVQKGGLDQASFHRIEKILHQYGLPLRIPSRLSISSLLDAMKLDKKSLKGKPRFVMIRSIGAPFMHHFNYCTPIEEPTLRSALAWMNDALCCH